MAGMLGNQLTLAGETWLEDFTAGSSMSFSIWYVEYLLGTSEDQAQGADISSQSHSLVSYFILVQLFLGLSPLAL